MRTLLHLVPHGYKTATVQDTFQLEWGVFARNQTCTSEAPALTLSLYLARRAAAVQTVPKIRGKEDAMAHGDITHIDIPVSDLAKAKEFYSGLFGWRIAEIPGFEGYPMWQAPNKISGGGLAPRGKEFSQPRSYVEVDSIDDTLAAAVAAGGEVAMGKEQISDTSWWAAIRDPDGNTMGLYEGTTDTDG